MKKVLFLAAVCMTTSVMAQYRYPLEGRNYCNPYEGPCDSVIPPSAPAQTITVEKKVTREKELELTDLHRNLENPFFMPTEGQVFSKTTAEIGGRDSNMRYNNNLGALAATHDFNIESDAEASFVFVEELGFGITDRVAFYLRAGYAKVEREYTNTTTNLVTLESSAEDPMGVTAGFSFQAVRSPVFSLNLHAEYTKAPDNYIGGFRDQMAAYAVIGKEKDNIAFALHLGILKNKEGTVSGMYDTFGNELIEKASTDRIARAEILKQVSPTFSLLFGLDYEMLSAETAGGSDDDVLRGR
ncbi:MAG: hypothetical protein JXQ74_01905, partial [Alphaproteobacteria bacterium]|nr:hypothetical protein [Alphaproteobacteria bacterium]